MSAARPADAPAFGLERIVFFSDAVFAIAITLLAIDIRLPSLPPHASDEDVRRAIADLAPQLFAFGLSFAVIAQYWVGHLRTFRYIRHADFTLVNLNLLFLFCIALLPFPTNVVALEGDRPSGAVLYAVFVVLTGLLSTLVWVYPSRSPALRSAAITDDLARRISLRAGVIPIVFALSIPVAAVAPTAAFAVWIAALPIQVLVTRRLGIGHSLEAAIAGTAALSDPPRR